MANNLQKLQQLATQYNINFQPLYSADALSKGNLNRVHRAVIGKHEYNKLGSANNTQLESIFKAEACGTTFTQTTERKTTSSIRVNDNGVYINGRRHDMLEIVRGVKVHSLLNYLSETKKDSNYYNLCTWLMDSKNRYQYLRTIENGSLIDDYFKLEYFFRTNKIYPTIEDLLSTIEIDLYERAKAEGLTGKELIGV